MNAFQIHSFTANLSKILFTIIICIFINITYKYKNNLSSYIKKFF